MLIYVPNYNVDKNIRFGEVINKICKEYVVPELNQRKLKNFVVAGIELYDKRRHKVYLDTEIQVSIGLKKQKKANVKNVGKIVNINLQNIKDFCWFDTQLKKDSVKILVMRWDKDWWIYWADFKGKKEIENKFKAKQILKVRFASHMPLAMRRMEKDEFFQSNRNNLEKDQSSMWRRYVTVSQKFSGIAAYDGNYFDLFLHAQDLYVLGYYYTSIIICRIASEQALISILIKTGHALEIYKQARGNRKLKAIEQLVETCRSHSLFKKKYPINKTAAKKLNDISRIAGSLVHPKSNLAETKEYKENAIKCMKNLQYVIKNHLNIVKDTGVVSGYKSVGRAKRLK